MSGDTPQDPFFTNNTTTAVVKHDDSQFDAARQERLRQINAIERGQIRRKCDLHLLLITCALTGGDEGSAEELFAHTLAIAEHFIAAYPELLDTASPSPEPAPPAPNPPAPNPPAPPADDVPEPKAIVDSGPYRFYYFDHEADANLYLTRRLDGVGTVEQVGAGTSIHPWRIRVNKIIAAGMAI